MLIATGLMVGLVSRSRRARRDPFEVAARASMRPDVSWIGPVRHTRAGITFTLIVPTLLITLGIVTTVSCFGDYGGYGFRGGFDGSRGFVTANGSALRIKRADSNDFVITLVDPVSALKVLNQLLA